MNEQPHDIKDDEIRIITSGNNDDAALKHHDKGRNRLVILISVVAAILLIVVISGAIYLNRVNDSDDELELVTDDVVTDYDNAMENVNETEVVADSIATKVADDGYVLLSDTTINNVPLSIFKPVNLTPELHIGTDVLYDSTARFVVQAADVRGDNGGIVGAYVNRGVLVSKGQAKSGFCAIIGGKINIGVADSTPLLEKALETDGYFFRQYPLVVAGQIVENKPKGKSLRKALAELDGEPVVIMSRKKMTFNAFSRSLVDLGVANAIYLIGGSSNGFAIDRDNRKITFGIHYNDMRQNINYIVWR